MEQAGLKVFPYRVDIPEFKAWVGEAGFEEKYQVCYGSLFVEKALEHYVGAQILDLKPRQVLVDVAAASSPWMIIAERLYHVHAFSLDLRPSTSPSGRQIAADATRMPFRDESIDCMALHCAYETFEGDADSRLVAEASRVLRSGGRMVILPLYMHHLYFAESSPGTDRRGLDYQSALRVWREPLTSPARFSRKYNVSALMERVVGVKERLDLKIYYIENETEVDPVCYLKFAALFEKTPSFALA